MGLASRAIDYSLRSIIKPYLNTLCVDLNGVQKLRIVAERAFSGLKPPLHKVTLDIDSMADVDIEVITPRHQLVRGTLIYCPGGGYVCCSPRTHRNLTVRLALQTGLRLIVLNYRKSPETHFSEAVDESLRIYEAVLNESTNASQTVFYGGDSAGGHLAISTLIKANMKNLPQPSGLICLSPWTDLSCPMEGRFHQHWDPLIPLDTLKQVANLILQGVSPYDARYSPVYADLSCLPPTLVQAVTTEVLYPDATRFVARAQEVGVEARLSSWTQAPHCFQLLAPLLPQAVAALQEITAFIDHQISKSYHLI